MADCAIYVLYNERTGEAMVVSDDQHAYGDQTWAHEQWHAQTDYPIPEQSND